LPNQIAVGWRPINDSDNPFNRHMIKPPRQGGSNPPSRHLADLGGRAMKHSFFTVVFAVGLWMSWFSAAVAVRELDMSCLDQASADANDETATTPAVRPGPSGSPIELTGRWKDLSTGSRYDITQSGAVVTAQFYDEDNICKSNNSGEKRDPYFSGALSNVNPSAKTATLSGDITVCVLEKCAASLGATKESVFEVEVRWMDIDADQGPEPPTRAQFSGWWRWEEIDVQENSCGFSGETIDEPGFNAIRLPCDEIAAVRRELDLARQVLQAYEAAYDGWAGQSFEQIQEQINQQFATGEDSTAGFGGYTLAEVNSQESPSGGLCVLDASSGDYLCSAPRIVGCKGSRLNFLNDQCRAHEDVHAEDANDEFAKLVNGQWQCVDWRDAASSRTESTAKSKVQSEIDAYRLDVAAYEKWLADYETPYATDCKGAEGF
jgi:hypothetical protein